MTKLIVCNWCGKPHIQPAQSALEALARCCKVPDDVSDIRAPILANGAKFHIDHGEAYGGGPGGYYR